MAANKPTDGGKTAGRRDGLEKYRAKRTASRTPEPFASSGKPGERGGPGLFVVHKHAATRLHYDFRLELDGVLESWAVPKGPSFDPEEKRYAVHVEPHPIDYAAFEGVIPEGNYGAGAVIVWDRGLWVPLEDPIAGLERGKLLFELKGYKLRGVWTLFRTKRPREKEPTNEWLMMKKPDGFADPDGERLPSEVSVLSGLSIEEMRDGPQRARKLGEELARLGAPRREVTLRELAPMLCMGRERPFSDPDWVFELKYDGYRLMASGNQGVAALRYRSGIDSTALFPEVVAAVSALPYQSFVIDGEAVVFDDDGRTNFNRLQHRSMLGRAGDIRRASIEHPVTMVVFDVLAFEGYDVRGLPLVERKRLLRELLPAAGPLKYSDHIAERGEEFYQQVQAMRLEGIVGKRVDSPYRPIRSEDWIKVRVEHTDDFAVVGYSAPKGARVGLGALHLACRVGERWRYAGKVGSGFSERQLDQLRAELDALPRWEPQLYNEGDSEVPRGADNTWVTPQLVAEVRYLDWPEGLLLRQPAFLRLREDKHPLECGLPARLSPPDEEREPPPPELVEEQREIRLTNLKKVFWPADDSYPVYTKGDLIEFYRDIAPWLVPYLKDRLVVLTRYPDGIDGKSFFQKDAPTWVPDWIHTETIWSESAEREIHYFVVEDADSLVFLANLGTIPLHIWSSRLSTLSRPDWTIIDLDPKGAPFTDVVTCARAVRALCDDIELPCYCKTSGSTGLHVLIPLGGQCTFEQGRDLAHLLAKVIESEHRDIATTARQLNQREGRVYLDFLQNGHGRLLVSPYSVRPMPGATVSAPLRWSEVNRKLDMRRFTIKTMIDRVKRMKSDPLLPVLDEKPDLARALALLGERQKDAPA
jgi:bifunctional non-homologous end joining protein LigD